ncbi:MAG: hypothetical protein ACFFB5_12865 [Promethearchaeota archaeon]
MYELNDDQNRIINVLKDPSHYIINSEENGIKGIPYKEIMKASGLTREKTLLSLGYLEANDIVRHECAVQRQIVDYHGRSNVEIAGQKIIRMFSLTSRGKGL